MSVNKGMIDIQNLSLAGDGTPLKTARLSVPNVYVTATKVLAVVVKENFHSLTTTGDRIIPETGIFLVITSIYLLLLILKITCLYFQCWNVSQDMTCCISCILFSL